MGQHFIFTRSESEIILSRFYQAYFVREAVKLLISGLGRVIFPNANWANIKFPLCGQCKAAAARAWITFFYAVSSGITPHEMPLQQSFKTFAVTSSSQFRKMLFDKRPIVIHHVMIFLPPMTFLHDLVICHVRNSLEAIAEYPMMLEVGSRDIGPCV